LNYNCSIKEEKILLQNTPARGDIQNPNYEHFGGITPYHPACSPSKEGDDAKRKNANSTTRVEWFNYYSHNTSKSTGELTHLDQNEKRREIKTGA
jgi:hypothetical protein